METKKYAIKKINRSTRKSKGKIKKIYLKTNDNTTIQNLWDATKQFLENNS